MVAQAFQPVQAQVENYGHMFTGPDLLMIARTLRIRLSAAPAA